MFFRVFRDFRGTKKPKMASVENDSMMPMSSEVTMWPRERAGGWELGVENSAKISENRVLKGRFDHQM